MQNTESRKRGSIIWFVTLIASLAFTAAPMKAAAEEVTYEGRIQGLNCTYYSKECPKDDLDIYAALENDFVLVLPDGKFFLLPNLSPLVKARHLTEKVRIRGKLDGSNIWVENLEVKEKGGWETVWNRRRHEEKRTAP